MTTIIKPLEWYTPSWSHDLSRCDSVAGAYAVWTHAEANGLWFWRREGSLDTDGECGSEEAAKAAAQADYEARILSAVAPQASDNAEEPAAVLDDLHSAMCLLETLSEAMPTDDVSAVMMSVMANNIRQKHFVGRDALASHPCTSTPAPDLEDKGGDGEP